MTAANGYEYLRRMIGNPTPDQEPNYRLTPHLQEGLNALNRRISYHFSDDTSITLVDGTQEYNLMTDCQDVEWVEWNDDLLQKVDMDHWRRNNVRWRVTAADFPREYAIYGRKIIFHPKPNARAVTADASPTIRYVSIPAEYSANGFAQLNSQDHRLPIYYAAADWLMTWTRSDADLQRARALMETFERESTAVAAVYAARRMTA